MKLNHVSIFFVFVLGGLLLPLDRVHAGGGRGGGLCAGFSSGSELIMLDNCFDGVAHFSPSGTTLVVKNDGALPHTFTAVDGSFDTGILQPGETAEINVSEDGINQVFCTLHGTRHGVGMAGVLVVGDAALEAVSATGVSQADPASERPTSPPSTAASEGLRILGEVRNTARITILTVIVVGVAIGVLIVALNRRNAGAMASQDVRDEAVRT